MITSETIGKLSKALSDAQVEMPILEKRGYSPYLKNHYVLLDDVLTAASDVLPSHGLSVLQLPFSTDDDKIGVRTRVSHSSGEFIEESIALPLADERGKSSAQVAGSIITYLRRYALTSLLMIASESDTDGSTKSDEKKAAQPDKKKTRAQAEEQQQQSDEKKGLKRPMIPAKLREIIARKVAALEEKPPARLKGQKLNRLAALYNKAAGSSDARVTFMSWLFERAVTSSKELSDAELKALESYIDPPDYDAGWDKPHPLAVREIELALKLIEGGAS